MPADDRCPCVVIGCRRSVKREAIAPDTEWICRDHWKLVDRLIKLLHFRIRRKRKRLGDPTYLTGAAVNVWHRAKRQAIERAMGITA